MKFIRITSSLSAGGRRRINRRAALHQGFVKAGRNTYAPLYADVHSTARHMMVVAGQTFDYMIC